VTKNQASRIPSEVADEAEIPTPTVIFDLDQVQRNLTAMADYTKSHGLKLRPHIKTHKSLAMAQRQIDSGAVGLTVAKVGEAELMAEATDDLLLAYPVVDPYRSRVIADLARHNVVHVAVDTRRAVETLTAAASAAGSFLGVLVDLDVGYHRTGVQNPEAALALATQIDCTDGLRLDGLFCFPGHITAPPDQQSTELADVDRCLQDVISLWKKHGLAAKIVSGGSTPTATQSHLVSALTEIRPGTYIYYDWNSVSGRWCGPEDYAASVVCTVVSDAVPGKVVIDAGSKTLTRDQHFLSPDTEGYGHVIEYPEARIALLTEEHGEIDITHCSKAPQVGQRLHVIPNHICPCVNLHDRVWLKHDAARFEQMTIDARGCVI